MGMGLVKLKSELQNANAAFKGMCMTLNLRWMGAMQLI
jgi:hypothetical protein